MKDTIEDLLTRRSVRQYTDKPVKKADLETILKAGSYAASGMGKQSPRIIATQNKELIARLSALNNKYLGANSDPFYGASSLAIVFADTSMPTYLYDGSLVMGNMMNAARALGLGSCWIHRAKEVFASEEGKALMKKWGVPESYEGIGHLVVGYAAKPAGEAAPRKDDYITWVE